MKHIVLFLAANPFGTDRRDLDREARALRDERAPEQSLPSRCAMTSGCSRREPIELGGGRDLV